MKAFAHAYDAEGMVSPALSWGSVWNTGVLFLFIIIPGAAGLMLQLQNVMPAEVMRGKRKNVRKQVLALMIVSLSAILISVLGIQDNHSDEGILFVKEYVPGDLQVTAGSIYENIAGGEAMAASNLEHISDTNGYSFRNAGRQIQKYVDSDHCQKVMHWFFIIIPAVAGFLVYFNTVFTNLLNRRKDFKIMYKIGIRKKEMYWMVMKEGLFQGGMAAGVVAIVQAALSAGRQEPFFRIFAVTDAGVVTACVLFPVFILWYMFHKRMAVSW